jgi:hypothetical protein
MGRMEVNSTPKSGKLFAITNRHISIYGYNAEINMPNKSYPNNPCKLDASSNPCFIPTFECIPKRSEIGHHFMKLGINSKELQDLSFTGVSSSEDYD